jgi:hypothetical protein
MAPTLALPGPSKPVRVEPLRMPEPLRDPAPPPPREAPEKTPDKEPARA